MMIVRDLALRSMLRLLLVISVVVDLMSELPVRRLQQLRR